MGAEVARGRCAGGGEGEVIVDGMEPLHFTARMYILLYEKNVHLPLPKNVQAMLHYLVDNGSALDVDPREWMEDVLLWISGNENSRVILRNFLPGTWAKQT